MPGLRWDGDERGEGVGDATAFADGAADLVAAMRQPGWVAEEPEVHLLPHLQRACQTLPFEIEDMSLSAEKSFDVRLRYSEHGRGVGHVRAAVFALLGSFAESATYVRQRRSGPAGNGETLLFEIVTGSLDDGAFAPHGHTVRITVLPATRDVRRGD